MQKKVQIGKRGQQPVMQEIEYTTKNSADDSLALSDKNLKKKEQPKERYSHHHFFSPLFHNNGNTMKCIPEHYHVSMSVSRIGLLCYRDYFVHAQQMLPQSNYPNYTPSFFTNSIQGNALTALQQKHVYIDTYNTTEA